MRRKRCVSLWQLKRDGGQREGLLKFLKNQLDQQKKGLRELKNLATSVNYDSRKSGEGRSGVADKALSVVQ